MGENMYQGNQGKYEVHSHVLQNQVLQCSK